MFGIYSPFVISHPPDCVISTFIGFVSLVLMACSVPFVSVTDAADMALS